MKYNRFRAVLKENEEINSVHCDAIYNFKNGAQGGRYNKATARFIKEQLILFQVYYIISGYSKHRQLYFRVLKKRQLNEPL